MPSSRGSSWPGGHTQVSCMAGRFFTDWATREAPLHVYHLAFAHILFCTHSLPTCPASHLSSPQTSLSCKRASGKCKAGERTRQLSFSVSPLTRLGPYPMPLHTHTTLYTFTSLLCPLILASFLARWETSLGGQNPVHPIYRSISRSQLRTWQNLDSQNSWTDEGMNWTNCFSGIQTARMMTCMAVCCCLVSKSCPTLLWPYGLLPSRFFCPWDSPLKITGVGCHFLLQGIFWPKDRTQVSRIAGRCFIAELPGKPDL